MLTAEQLARWGNTLGTMLHTTHAVTTTASDTMPAERDRIRHKLTITNAGDNTVFLALGENAIVNSGICLLPGSTFTLDKGEAFNGRVSALTSSSTSTLAIFAAYRSPEIQEQHR